MAPARGLHRLAVLLLTLALVAGGVYAAVFFLQRSETLVSERCSAAAWDSAGWPTPSSPAVSRTYRAIIIGPDVSVVISHPEPLA